MKDAPKPSLPDPVRQSVERWGKKAHRDLADAKELLRVGSLENAAYHAEQSAEKALKAVLILHQKEYPYSHDLKRILGRVAVVSRELARACGNAPVLTTYATTTRYPNEEEVTATKAQEAAATAEDVYAKVKAYVAEYGVNWP